MKNKQNTHKLFGLGCHILLYTARVPEGIATWKNTIDSAWILKILQKHLPREHIQNEKKIKLCIVHCRLTQTVTGLNSHITLMYEMLRWGQGQDSRIQNTKKLALKHFRYYLEANWLSVTEKTKTNIETS